MPVSLIDDEELAKLERKKEEVQSKGYHYNLAKVKADREASNSNFAGEKVPFFIEAQDQIKAIQDAQNKQYGGAPSTVDAVNYGLNEGFYQPNKRGIQELYHEFGAGKAGLPMEQFSADEAARREEDDLLGRMPSAPEAGASIGVLTSLASKAYNNFLSPDKQNKNMDDLLEFKNKQISEKEKELLYNPGNLDLGNRIAVGGTEFIANLAPFLLTKNGAKQGMTGATNAFMRGLNRLPIRRDFPFAAVRNEINPRLAMPNDPFKLIPANVAGSAAIGTAQGAASEDSTAGEGFLSGAIGGVVPALPIPYLPTVANRIANSTPVPLRAAIRQAEDYANRTGLKLRMREGNYGAANAQNLEKKMYTAPGVGPALERQDMELIRDLNERAKQGVMPDYIGQGADSHGLITEDFGDQVRARASGLYGQNTQRFNLDDAETRGLVDRIGALGDPTLIGSDALNKPMRILRSATLPPATQPRAIGENEALFGLQDLPNTARVPQLSGNSVQKILTHIDKQLSKVDKSGAQALPENDANALRLIRQTVTDAVTRRNPGAIPALQEADRLTFGINELERGMSPLTRVIGYKKLGELDAGDMTEGHPIRNAFHEVSNVARIKDPNGENTSHLSTWDLNNGGQPPDSIFDGQGIMKKIANLRTFAPSIFASSTNPYTQKAGDVMASFFLAPKTILTASPQGALATGAAISNAGHMMRTTGEGEDFKKKENAFDYLLSKQNRK
jgi:hypothetical protein